MHLLALMYRTSYQVFIAFKLFIYYNFVIHKGLLWITFFFIIYCSVAMYLV